MKFIITYIFIFIVLGCNEIKSKSESKEELLKPQTETSVEKKNGNFKSEKGFLYVSINKIYYEGQNLVIFNRERDTLAFFNKENVYLTNKTFNIIDDDYLYKEGIKVNTFDPEYGLFILDCEGIENQQYKVKINNNDCFIDIKENSHLLKFKTPEQHVMESYPYLYGKNNTPLRVEPNDESEIIENYDKHLYEPVELKGDWLKVKDDKDCYVGEEPSKENIVGWVRWRKDGKIIIDIRYSC